MRGPTAVVTIRSIVPLEIFRQSGSPANDTVSIAIAMRLGFERRMNARIIVEDGCASDRDSSGSHDERPKLQNEFYEDAERALETKP